MRADRSCRGFTLIELIIGMVVFSAVMVFIIRLLGPQASRSAEPILQARAIELAQSLFNEISTKSYDEQSDRSGGGLRCGEQGHVACSDASTFGASDADESRATFDDVDDYHQLATATTQNSLGESLGSKYQDFSADVSVTYPDANNRNVKQITITVGMPKGDPISFTTYRHNY